VQILVTGGSGMLGTAIRKELVGTLHTFLAPTSKELDLLSSKSCTNFFKSNKFDLVIHCAAIVGGIKANIDSPYRFLNSNLKMDLNLFGSAREFRIQNLIYIASSCMYPSNHSSAMPEELIGFGPLESTNEGYALAKLVGTKTVTVTSVDLGLTWRTLVLSNLYGPGDHFENDRSHLIAAIIKKVTEAKSSNSNTVEMWGDGKARREFTFVSDVAEFIVSNLANLESLPVTLNLGAGMDFSVREYYEEVLKVNKLVAEIRPDVTKPSGMKRKLLNSDRAKSFGWSPKISLEEGLKLTVDWYLRQGELTNGN
jgi:GDP-L-fucose synthase